MGLLTEELLKIGVPYVHLYEGQVEFFDTLNKLYDKYPDRFSLNKGNLFHLSKTMHVNYRSYGYDDTDDLLINVQRNEWNKESCMQLVGSTSRPMFVNHLILSTVFRTCLMSKGRPTFYIAILPSMWSVSIRILILLKNILPNYIMFQTIFNYHVFGKLDRKAFIPWNRSMTKKDLMKPETMCNIDTEDISFLYLVKMEPKQEIPVVLNGKEDLFYFWHFVRQNFYKPSNRIIPTLERVIPGCGVRLIAKDYNVFTMFNDLDIKQIQDLFLEFRSWPEFEASAFTSSADQTKLWFSNYLEE
ncbi:Dimethyladenosine transferase 2, mitochondrial [Dufourea novaeangliae]|uniref:Dimethyladenosine transferase 2, mitochondrial n=1 Tax=Dufourea novaeangliae TaxID=178035 RepID=A0A154P2Y9_DUFNO|nr:Dimethyladenosine transferase 2, mitochondrial [Dufourea novaeangliae]